MSHLFYGLSYITNLPDISKWNTSNITDMNSMFSKCNNLSYLSDISKWNIKKMSKIYLICFLNALN